jgi:histidyl-tRNA synthetase
MRDVLPAEKAKRERALAVIRDVYRRHGFDEIEAPALEDHARLHAGIGGDNEKLSYSVLKRGLTQGDLQTAAAVGDPLLLADLGLRYDLTVPLARFYATNQAALPPVFRALHTGPVWRAERPQKGRYRQFTQCDIDILGEPGPVAELELLAATSDAIDALGLAGTTIRVNDRRILNRLLEAWGVPADRTEAAMITIDKLDKIGVEGVIAELGERGITTEGLPATFATLATAGWSLLEAEPPAWLDVPAYRGLLALRDALPGVRIEFDPMLVRGMGYYTGTIFEVTHPASGGSIGGGGRYDGMLGRFLGRDVPAVGFSLGFERVIDVMPDAPLDSGAVALLVDGEVPGEAQLAAKRSELAAGRRVRLERARKNRRGQLEALAAEGFGAFRVVTADGVSEARALA